MWSAILLWLACLASATTAVDIRITANRTVAIPETLYGWMWEDINHSTDGGIYAELLQNRAFQAVEAGTAAALTAWKSYGGASISVTNATSGVSAALPNSLQVDVPSSLNGIVGFENEGYWGIKVDKSWRYQVSFYAKSPTYRGRLTISLKSAGDVFASTTVTGISSSWKKFSFSFQPKTSATDSNNVFSITFDRAGGSRLYFGLLSLFPPTYRGRKNGLRIDLAEALAEMAPKVWRFPGGNNLEGTSFDNRWKWNETIGPLESRPGRFGNWGYPNTDGMGLMEYFDWAEDLNAEPILGVWSGISIGDYAYLPGWPVVPEDQLQPYVDDVLDEIEFITGDPVTSRLGRLRASYGRVKPYPLKYIEIGNEDQFQPASYAGYRWKAFVTAISERYPGRFEFIATTYPETALDPAYTHIDYHQYNVPAWFIGKANWFDDYPRNGTKYFIGEYAVTSTNPDCIFGPPECGRLVYPTLQGALAESVFMAMMERNSDVVFASAYAPTLQHLNNYQWTPDIISFNAAETIKSTSFYAQKLFSVNRGTHVLATLPTSSSATAPLYWVASVDARTSDIILKIVNIGAADVRVNLVYDFVLVGSQVRLTTLSSSNNIISNTLESPEAITPEESTVELVAPEGLNLTLSGQSLTILRVQSKSQK